MVALVWNLNFADSSPCPEDGYFGLGYSQDLQTNAEIFAIEVFAL